LGCKKSVHAKASAGTQHAVDLTMQLRLIGHQEEGVLADHVAEATRFVRHRGAGALTKADAEREPRFASASRASTSLSWRRLGYQHRAHPLRDARLAEANRGSPLGIRFRQGTGTAMPYEAGSFSTWSARTPSSGARSSEAAS